MYTRVNVLNGKYSAKDNSIENTLTFLVCDLLHDYYYYFFKYTLWQCGYAAEYFLFKNYAKLSKKENSEFVQNEKNVYTMLSQRVL